MCTFQAQQNRKWAIQMTSHMRACGVRARWESVAQGARSAGWAGPEHSGPHASRPDLLPAAAELHGPVVPMSQLRPLWVKSLWNTCILPQQPHLRSIGKRQGGTKSRGCAKEAPSAPLDRHRPGGKEGQRGTPLQGAAETISRNLCGFHVLLTDSMHQERLHQT